MKTTALWNSAFLSFFCGGAAMKKIHDDSKDFKSNETHQQTMGVITRAMGVLQLKRGVRGEGGACQTRTRRKL